MTIHVVLDTNVCLDLFVFHDPRWKVITQGLQNQIIHASTRKDCREEWLAVLHYSHLPVSAENRDSIIAAFDANIACCEVVQKATILPRCTDKDDQKFLEYCRDANVDVLVTKDKALLKLARKVQKLQLFSIVTPEKFVAQLTKITTD
jgi:putative PIN family toxin of toxin-antitoxin system